MSDMSSSKKMKACLAEIAEEELEDGDAARGLLHLPDELLLMILKDVSSMDLVSLACTCCRLHSFIADWKLLSILNFHYETRLTMGCLKKFLTFRHLTDEVVTIDLTSCYWLTSSTILKIVKSLKNVENVLVADTALSPAHLKKLLTASSKVKRLSWTWNTAMTPNGIEDALLRLHFLYVIVHKQTEAMRLSTVLSKCTNLKELWVVCPEIQRPYQYFRAGLCMQNLEQFTVYPSDMLAINSGTNLVHSWQQHPLVEKPAQLRLLKSFLAFNWTEVIRVSKNEKCSLRRLSVPSKAGQDVAGVLDRMPELTSLHMSLPYGHSPHLLANKPLLRELGLCASSKEQLCSANFCQNVSHCPQLRRLHLPVHSLVRQRDSTRNVSEEVPSTSSGSKQRVSRIPTCPLPSVETPFQRMVRFTPLLEELEIGTCDRHNLFGMPGNLEWDFSSLKAVTQWPHLTSLTLAMLPIQQANFLEQITQGCKGLERLCIMDLGPHGKCVYSADLLKALPHCSSLIDFRWQQSNIGDTKKLWNTLSCLPTLHRVSVISDGISDLDGGAMLRFVEKCSSLVFLYAVTNATKKKCKQIRTNILSRWSKQRQALVVWLGQLESSYNDLPKLPTVHVGEMVLPNSRIVGTPSSSWHYLSPRNLDPYDWAPYL